MIYHIKYYLTSSNICYTKSNDPIKLLKADSEGKKQEEIYELPNNKTITYVSWEQNDIIATLSDISSSANSEIVSISPETHKQKSLISTASHIISSVWASTDESKYFYLAKNKNESSEYKLNIADKDGASNLGSANTIIGWAR